MGLMTLADFRTDLQSALGDRGIGNPRLDRWINAGYYDLAGAVEFEILTNSEAPSTASGVAYVTAPTNTLIIKLVRDTTSDALLGWVPLVEYWRRSQSSSGPPTVWTRQEANIYLHPVPDGTYALFIVTIEPPTVLAAVGDLTLFPETWDQAVFMLAAHHALLALAEEQRAVTWLSRAITYIQSRMTETDLQANAAGLGASLPSGMQGLTNRLEGLGGS